MLTWMLGATSDAFSAALPCSARGMLSRRRWRYLSCLRPRVLQVRPVTRSSSVALAVEQSEKLAHAPVRDPEAPRLFYGRLCSIPRASFPKGLNGGRDGHALALAVPRSAARAEPRMRVGQRRTDFERSGDTVRRISTRGNASLDF